MDRPKLDSPKLDSPRTAHLIIKPSLGSLYVTVRANDPRDFWISKDTQIMSYGMDKTKLDFEKKTFSEQVLNRAWTFFINGASSPLIG